MRVERGRMVKMKRVVKRSLLVDRMVSELKRILNGEKQRQIAAAVNILSQASVGGSWRRKLKKMGE